MKYLWIVSLCLVVVTISSCNNVQEENATLGADPSVTHTPTEQAHPISLGIGALSERIIALAKSKLKHRYEPGSAGPERFDCSGFVYYLFAQNDVSIPRTSIDQSRIGRPLNREEIRRGDLLFFDTSEQGHVNHSGIYLGDGQFIHASSGKAYGVTISDLDGWYQDKFLWGVRQSEE
jgi:cell wall-associated NlpC family hydrolase